MTDMHTRVGGAWKAIDGLHTRVGGVWKEVQTGYIKVSGAWKEFYSTAVAQLYELSGTTGSPNETTFIDSSACYAGWTFGPFGDVLQNENGSQTPFRNNIEWAFPEVATGDHWIRWTGDVGEDPNLGTPAEGAWTETTSNVSMLWYQTVDGDRTGSVKVEIATDALGSNIVATGYYGGSAVVI